MSPAQKDQLLNRQQQFLKLEPAEQQRVRQLHEQITRDPQAGKLREVLGHYCQWLAGLPVYRQDKLKETPPAAADPADQDDSSDASPSRRPGSTTPRTTRRCPARSTAAGRSTSSWPASSSFN